MTGAEAGALEETELAVPAVPGVPGVAASKGVIVASADAAGLGPSNPGPKVPEALRAKPGARGDRAVPGPGAPIAIVATTKRHMAPMSETGVNGCSSRRSR